MVAWKCKQIQTKKIQQTYPKHCPFSIFTRIVGFDGNFFGTPVHSQTPVFCLRRYCHPTLITTTMTALLVTIVTVNNQLVLKMILKYLD